MQDELTAERAAAEEREGASACVPYGRHGRTRGERRSHALSPVRLARRELHRPPLTSNPGGHPLGPLADALRPLICDVVRDEIAKLQPSAPEVFLSTRAAAGVAGVAAGTIRRWVNEGRLTGHHAGRVLRVRRADLEKLLGTPRRGARCRCAAIELTPEQRARRDLGEE